MRRLPLQWPRQGVGLLSALLLFASTTVSAQGPTIGIKFGASEARQQFSSSFGFPDRTPTRAAPTVALTVAMPLHGPVGLQVETSDAPKGFTYPGGGQTAATTRLQRGSSDAV